MSTLLRSPGHLDVAPLMTGTLADSWRFEEASLPWGVRPDEPKQPAENSLADLGASLEQLSIRQDPEREALWCAFEHPVRPCFTPELLEEIGCFQVRLERALERPSFRDHAAIGTLVWHSNFPDVWNLGGDLELFVQLITSGQRESLRAYAHQCVDTVWRNWNKGNARLETIALIEGDALGGGFEAVLSNDVIIAERHSKFGLPEILFRMFPGMGAYSFLSRRIGGAEAEALITSGRLYSADEMAAMGIVDLVVETGTGREAVEQWLSSHRRRRRVLGSLGLVRRRCQPITYDELIDVTEIWVDTAFGLEACDLRKMERLAKAQDRRRAREISRAAA